MRQISMRALIAITMVIGATLLLSATHAMAAKTSVVGKVPGKTLVVKATPYDNWLACWSETSTDKYTLYVINANSGKSKEVDQCNHPGGLTWIPKKGELFYVKGQYIESAETTRIIYYRYDPVSEVKTKIREITDVLETYKLDPIASEDGSKVFHLTIGQGMMPSFNVYDAIEKKMTPALVPANIGADYDLSNDGTMLYWPLSNEEGDLFFVGWNLDKMDETWNIKFWHDYNPADGGAMIKVDSANRRIATLAYNENPRMQMCIYGWDDKSVLSPIPVFLETGEEILHYDWIGITGKIYCVIYNDSTGLFSIEIIDPLLGIRTPLVNYSSDEIAYVDYSHQSDTYYYAVINEKAKRAESSIVRLTTD